MAESIKIGAIFVPDEFLGVYNNIVRTPIFPKLWKKLKVALSLRGSTSESKYRPICILDTLRKLLEYLAKYKLEDHITLTDTQYGFRKRKIHS